ncbi:phosphotransferase family protein [Litorilituus lipolyticus]|uniref:Aminoglycoside phosphotransferase family protein n=1 Tax=Litorilituus lipolyticus TaxID=2491017 RepID=A0A502L5V0_9GAMM|nr:aminoglycoside phosphotransferase family protein [Litorilituus lipolyticus]TPH17651.1 aminoglycoside phosphotransferase family protein [Litorilituus lipolyticus]
MVKLPNQPSYQHACEIIDNFALSFWLPLLETLQEDYALGAGQWHRINEGGNALFDLNDAYIVKVVPPNWISQGLKEIDINSILVEDLSVERPALIAHGEINGWLYLVMTKLSGICLAEIWPGLTQQEKLPIIKQVGQLMREFSQVKPLQVSCLSVDWSTYIARLKEDCLARHKRNKLDDHLYQQITSYLEEHLSDLQIDNNCFIHMDLHPWNLMAQQNGSQWAISGVLDFGDAIIGKSHLYEVLTPCCFMVQGDKVLYKAMIEQYGIISTEKMDEMQDVLMSLALIREASDINFVMGQVPKIGKRDNWSTIARELFPLIN